MPRIRHTCALYAVIALNGVLVVGQTREASGQDEFRKAIRENRSGLLSALQPAAAMISWPGLSGRSSHRS